MLILQLIINIISIALTDNKEKSVLYGRISLFILLSTLLLIYSILDIPMYKKGLSLYGGLFQITAITQSFTVFLLILSTIIIGLSSYYWETIKIEVSPYNTKKNIEKEYKEKLHNKVLNRLINNALQQPKNECEKESFILEYPLVMLFVVLGGLFLVSSNNLVSVFLSIELQSYGLYLISTIHRNSELSTKAGLLYFLLGGLSSCIILLGISLLYANTGNTDLEAIYLINTIYESTVYQDSSEWVFSNISAINFAIVVMLVGFLFKISAAPFHFWSPDVYDAVPTKVTTFIAVIPKISLFIFFIELLYLNQNDLTISWTNNFLLSSLLSLIIGTVLGLSQFRIKRLYAYSTISHLGFILLALSIYSIESIQAFLFYLLQYSLSNLNAFLLLISVGSIYMTFSSTSAIAWNQKGITEIKNSPIQLISQIKGYYQINPMLAISLGITLFSFIGIPPLLGFFGKQMVLSAALDSGYIFMTILGILTSVISAVYYLAVIKNIFFEDSYYKWNKDSTLLIPFSISSHYYDIRSNPLQSPLRPLSRITKGIKQKKVFSGYLSNTISILTLIILVFIFVPEEWLNYTNILALMYLNI